MELRTNTLTTWNSANAKQHTHNGEAGTGYRHRLSHSNRTHHNVNRNVALRQGPVRRKNLFSGINMHQLWCLQKVFFIMILGGPQDYSGPCLIQIRKMLVINNNNKFAEGHFEIFMTHLRSTLCLLNVKTDEQREVMERVAKWKSFV